MTAIFYALLVACVVGVALLAVNLKTKLPKNLFAFTAVLILTLMFALFMEEREKTPAAQEARVPAETPERRATEIFSGTFSLRQGNNDFPVRVPSAAARGMEYVFEFDAGTPFGSAADFDCELRGTDGRVLKCSALVFSGAGLKCVFVFPEGFDVREATTLRLICGSAPAPTLTRITEREI
ncbi:MAG: hypothetical protein ACI4QA_06865 [Candidatus Spyradosoma sp.]